MDIMNNQLVERFLTYVKVDTQSNEASLSCPSTEKQFDLLNLLKDELAAMEYFDQFQNRDPRMAQTLHGPTYVQIDATVHEDLDWERTINGYRIIKYISDASHEGATTSTSDFALFRYAEVLLNYAEARAELGELNDADVAATIDVIRTRVGMPKMGTVPTKVDPVMKEYYPNVPEGAHQAAILEIRRERMIELCYECHRYTDIRTWMIAEDVRSGYTIGCNVKATNDNVDGAYWQRREIGMMEYGFGEAEKYGARKFTKKSYLEPFPTSEVNKVPALRNSQNLGW